TAIEIVAAEVCIAVSREDLKDAAFQLENGNVECAAAEVIDGDDTLLALLQAVREGGGGRLIHDPHDVQSGDPAGVFRGLALAVVEIRGDRDNGFSDLFTEEALGAGFQLLQDHRGDLRRREGFPADVKTNHAVFLAQLIGKVFKLVGDVGKTFSHETLDV